MDTTLVGGLTPSQLLEQHPGTFWLHTDDQLRVWFETPDEGRLLGRLCLASDQALANICERRLIRYQVRRLYVSFKFGLDSPEQRRTETYRALDDVDIDLTPLDRELPYNRRPRQRPLSWTEQLILSLTLKHTGTVSHTEVCFEVAHLKFVPGAREPVVAGVRYERFPVSLRHGVAMVPTGSRNSFSNSYEVYEVDQPDLRTARRLTGAYLFMCLIAGCPFDRVGYWLNYVPLLHTLTPHVTLDKKQWLCSQAVAIVLQMIDNRYQILNPKRCSPTDVYTAFRQLNNNTSTDIMPLLTGVHTATSQLHFLSVTAAPHQQRHQPSAASTAARTELLSQEIKL